MRIFSEYNQILHEREIFEEFIRTKRDLAAPASFMEAYHQRYEDKI